MNGCVTLRSPLGALVGPNRALNRVDWNHNRRPEGIVKLFDVSIAGSRIGVETA